MDHIDTYSTVQAKAAWTEARLERLVSLWNQRLSASQIARVLGPGVSRSAVVGKLLRLGLRRSGEERQNAQVEGGRRSHARRGPGGPRETCNPPLLPSAPLPDPMPCGVVPRLATILELCGSSCRWPYVVGEETRFCAHPAKPESSYCPAHHAIAYFGALPPLTLEALEGRAERRRPLEQSL